MNVRRREFIRLAGAAGATAVLPNLALAQQSANVPRVAYLDNPKAVYQSDGFFQGLSARGYVVGKNIYIEWFTAPTIADLPVFAARAVASAPTIILAGGSAAALAVAQVTKTIPVVFRVNSDPVALGLVSNLAHPGGNLTGAADLGSVTAAKEIGFLQEMMPGLSRIAFFGRSADGATDAVQRDDILTAGKATGVDIIVIDVTNSDDLLPYFAQTVAARAQAVYFGTYAYQAVPVSLTVLNALSSGQKQQPTFNSAYLAANNNAPNVSGILSYLALLNGLPGIWGVITGAGITSGSLFAYGETVTNGFRRAAYFVDEIVRGAKPQDLPVDLPTKYDLYVNLKTAKALGLVVPQSVLITATEIFE